MTTRARGVEWRTGAWGALACALALTPLTTGTALAAVPSTAADHVASRPMIAGTVVMVNDRQMIVDTDQGERITLELDSRTMAPRDLAPGMVMRAEFLAMEDCRFHAQRIHPIRHGASTHRPQAYANTRIGRDVFARSTMGYGDHGHEVAGSMAVAESRRPPTQEAGEPTDGTTMKAVPATADYQFSTRPMVAGRAIAVSDHRLLIETDQGQQVGMVMDSRTMVPGEVAAGADLRVEFTRMKDGRYYAQRVSRNVGEVADREQAYAHTRDGDVMLAGSTSDCGFVDAAPGNAVTSGLERRGGAEAVLAQSAPVEVVEKEEMLPQTASNQSSLLLLGMIAVGLAGVVKVLRGLRVV